MQSSNKNKLKDLCVYNYRAIISLTKFALENVNFQTFRYSYSAVANIVFFIFFIPHIGTRFQHKYLFAYTSESVNNRDENFKAGADY